MPRPLRGARYANGASPTLIKLITEWLPYTSFLEADAFYHDVIPQLNPAELALLGCNDRYFLLTGLCNRVDMIHPWRYDRCREVELDPDGYIDLWFREAGKAVNVEESVPTPQGWKKHGDLRAGDRVFGPDGKPCTVVATTQVWTDIPCSSVTFDDGYSVVVSDNHRWGLHDGRRRKGWVTKVVRTADLARHDVGVKGPLRRYRMVRSVEPVPPVPVSCIQVDREDGMYLIGRQMVPTHNSSIISFAGSIQEILCNPEITIGIFSNTRDISRPFLSQIKQELENNETLHALYPDVLWRDKRERAGVPWSVDGGITVKRLGNPKESSIEAHGLIDAMPTGRHFDLQIFNDVITEKNVTNPEQIRKSGERFELADNLGKSEGSRKWIEGTRYCTIGSMRILMADWTHKPITDVRLGDEIVGWELRDGARYLRPARVVNRGIHFQQQVFRYTLANGRSVTSTADHRWWRGPHGGGAEYRPLGLPVGTRRDRPIKGKKLNGRLVALRELLLPTERDDGRVAGWLAGFFDGEGTMQLNTGKNRASGSVCITQSMANPGLIDEVRSVLRQLGFHWSEGWLSADGRERMTHDRCIFYINGGWRERYRFLAQIAPAKRSKLAQSLFARLHTNRIKLAKIEDAGLADVHWLETDTGNYVVEGFCSSNSFADYYGIMIENGVAEPRVYPATDDGTLNGKPVLLSPQAWEKKKRAQRTTIAAQMLQNPIAGQENTFQTKWLKPYWVRPVMMNVYIIGDPSKGKNKTSDRTALAVIGIDAQSNRYLLDGYCHRMPMSERWKRLKELHKKWSNMPGVQLVKVGYERYGAQTDDEYFDEKMRLEGVRFEIQEVSWTREAGRESKQHRVERLEPDFREGSFFVPGKVWHSGVEGGQARWFIREGSDDIHYEANPAPHMQERRARANGELWRIFDPIRRLDEDGNIYDLTRVFFEEFRFFPFSPRDDLIDATSRIYDLEPMPAFRHEVVEVVDYPDA